MSLLTSVNEAARGEPFLTPNNVQFVQQYEFSIGTGFTTSAAVVYPAGTIATKVSTSTFIPETSGNYLVQLFMDNVGINWNSGTQSVMDIQVYNQTDSTEFSFPLYTYAAIPTTTNVRNNMTTIAPLVAGKTYSVQLTVNPITSNVDLTGCGANIVGVYYFHVGQ